MENKFKTVSHDELLDRHFGKIGTSKRDQFEAELQADVIAYHLKQLLLPIYTEESSLTKSFQIHCPCDYYSHISNGYVLCTTTF